MRTKTLDTFYVRAPRLNQLNLLQQLSSDPHLTQAELARRCNLSVAMVNNYMKELCSLGLLEYRRKSSKTVSYHLTSSGEAYIDSYRQELIQEMVQLFAEAKARIQQFVIGPASDGLRRVVLFGNGHLAELTFHALDSAGLSVIGVCADDPTLFGREWCGREVLNASQIRYMAPDAVIVADLGRSDEICRNLHYLAERGIRLIRLDGASDPIYAHAAEAASHPASIAK
jgi:predicted transcriptional regulator